MKKMSLRRIGVAHEAGSFKPTLQDCLAAVLDQSDSIMADILMGLELSLAPTKDKKLQVLQGPAVRAAIEQLRKSAPEVKKTFELALRKAMFDGGPAKSAPPPMVRFDDFQFLEEEQIDANIEFALTQQEVMLSVEDALPAVNGLISALMGWTTVQAQLNPVKPESFIQALRETFGQHIASTEVRAIMMVPTASMLGVSLRALYKELADWLRSQGVEPVVMASAASGGIGAHAKPVESTITRTMLTLDKLRRLLTGELDPQGGVRDFTHTLPASFVALEDMKMVEPMMQRLAQRAQQTRVMDAKDDAGQRARRLVQREHNVGKKKLGMELGEEVIRLMLDNLMQDRRMLPEVRQSLKSMESLLIRLAQTDVRFFSERQHAARQFLDKITSRSLAFTSSEDPGFLHFHQTLDGAIATLSQGEVDAPAFAKVLAELEVGWSREEQAQRQLAEEAARTLLHAEQRNLLAQRLALDFVQRMADKKIPELISAFLRGPWAQVVAESQLSVAGGAADPHGYLALVDDLIWSVQRKLARRNRARLVEMVPGMLIKLRQGLQLVSYPEERIPVFFDELIAIHEKALEWGRAAPAAQGDVAEVAPQTSTDEDDGISVAEVPLEDYWTAEGEYRESDFGLRAGEAASDFAELAEVADPGDVQTWDPDLIGVGAWVDLALGREWVRAQLTWASPHRTLFMFISGAGMAHSMSRRTMDRLHGLGLIRLVSDGRVMDNALDAVAQTALRNDVGRTPDSE